MSCYSSNHTIVNLVESIKKFIDNANYFEKAFDTADHQFYYKNYHYDIRGLVHNWFRSYLSNQKQLVFISGCSPEVLSIRCGVPQGSTLGRLVFYFTSII